MQRVLQRSGVTSPPVLHTGDRMRVPCLGVDLGIITGRSTCDRRRYRVSFFSRHFWAVRHKWVTRSVIEFIGAVENAAEAALSA